MEDETHDRVNKSTNGLFCFSDLIYHFVPLFVMDATNSNGNSNSNSNSGTNSTFSSIEGLRTVFLKSSFSHMNNFQRPKRRLVEF